MPRNIEIQLLGGFSITVDGTLHDNLPTKSRRGVSLLTYLILQRGKAVSVQRLSRELWGSRRSENPENALKTLISRLRTLLNGVSGGLGSAIQSEQGGYRWENLPGVRVDVGGGVRSLGRVEQLLGYGASRVAMGTALVRSPELAREAAARFGDALVADVAARDGRVQVSGWREDASLLVDDLVGELAQMGFRHLVYTDANRDGMRTGIDAEAYRRLAGVAGFPVVASGGAARLDDVRALAALGDDVVEGVICGRALYEGAFTLPEALRAARGDDDEEGAC